MSISLFKILALASLTLSLAVPASAVCNEGDATLKLTIDGNDVNGEVTCTTLSRLDTIQILGFANSGSVDY
jgi:hypothetical protein